MQVIAKFIAVNKAKITDNHLFEQIKKGNKFAFDLLFDKYYQQLCYFIETYTKSNYLAEELVADIFVNIWIKRKKIIIHSSIKSYLYTSAKNNALMHLRKNRLITEDLENNKQNIKYESNPEKKLLKKENEIRVQKLLQLIPTKSRQVFILHRLDGLRYKEIAEVMSISIKTVENHMGKALRILRENLNALSDYFT